MLQTPLCRAFGIEFPILSVGMSWLAGPELAAAVSNAGGCGVVGVAGMVRDQVRARIRETRALTNKPFRANIIIARMQEGQVEACLDEGAPLIVFFWGDPSPYIRDAHRAGSKVFLQVGSLDEAKMAAAAGVDGIIAQGVEAGGHVKGTTALSTLLPSVAAAVKPLPVIAAGGIANGRGLAAALTLGARLCRWERGSYAARRPLPRRLIRRESSKVRPRTPSIRACSTSAGMPRTVCCATARSSNGKRPGAPPAAGGPAKRYRSAPRLAVERLSNCGNIGRTPIQRAASTGILRMPCYMLDNPAR